MGGKDHRSRPQRRAARRARSGLQEAETAVAGSEGLEAAQPDTDLALPVEPQKPEQEAAVLLPAAALPTIEEDQRMTATAASSPTSKKAASVETPARSPVHLLLSKVPTPTRSPCASDFAAEATAARGAGGQSPASSRFGMPPQRGPEPWCLSDPLAPAPPTPKGCYREWLQARGQQAMQRSVLNGQQPATGARQQVPQPSLPLPQQQAVALQAATWAVSGEASPMVQLQHWLAAGTEMSPVAAHQQSPVAFGTCGQQRPTLTLGPAGCGHQLSQVGVGAGQLSPAAFGACGPQGAAFGACQQGSATPLAGQQSPTAFGICQPGAQSPAQERSQQEILAALVPGGFSRLNGEQLAEQLRAAAPCCYDD